MSTEPTPICKIAQVTGEVPLECLFGCQYNCAEKHRKAEKAKAAAEIARKVADEFKAVE